jgi:predicted AAA+ superfamily ATPase
MSEAMEIAERQNTSIEEIRQILRELAEEHKESKREFDQQVKEYNKRFGDFTNSYGRMVECIVAPNLLEKLCDIGFDFHKASRDIKVVDKKNQIFLQIDILLENGDKAMLVEVKSELETKDVKKHIERLEKMRQHADYRGDTRKFLGAVAGIEITPDAKDYALEQGLYVFEPSGETFDIISPHTAPKEW